jgi:hypothetical protein
MIAFVKQRARVRLQLEGGRAPICSSSDVLARYFLQEHSVFIDGPSISAYESRTLIYEPSIFGFGFSWQQ